MAYSSNTLRTRNNRYQQTFQARVCFCLPLLLLLTCTGLAHPGRIAAAPPEQGVQGPTADSQQVIKLEPGKNIERELAGSDAAGRYQIRIDALRMTLPEDKQLLVVFDKDNRASELAYIGYVQQRQGNFVEALEAYQKSLMWSEATDNKTMLVYTFNSMGRVHFVQGNYAQALDYYRKSLTLSEQLGATNLIAGTLNSMSLAYANIGNFGEALNCAQRTLELEESLNNKAGTAVAHMSLGLVYGHMADNVRALDQFRKSLAVSQELGRQGLIANALEKIANVYNRQGNYIEALDHAQRALKINEELKASRNIIFSLDPDTALLEYALGNERSYLWVVTQNYVKSFELPGRDKLETSVRRVVELLSDGKRWATDPQIDKEYAEANKQLSLTLLPPALMSELKVRRLVIVGDGALQYLPFSALSSPNSKGQTPK